MMGILQEILAWSKTLPGWQSDAIARLFAKQALGAADIDDLLALLKLECGIPDPKGRVPVPLAVDQIPAPPQPSTQVALLRLRNLQHVNAIAPGTAGLTFAPKGLTVIYGDNGSGKSGYARVLKRACRARDQAEAILPNAHESAAKSGKAEAIIEFSLNDQPKEVRWVDGAAPPDPLSAIAVFDHRCARAYLDSEGDFAYAPYGLDIFEGLVGACRELKARIDQEIGQCTPDLAAFDDLLGATEVGRLVERLSAKTDPKEVERLAAVTAADIAQRDAWDRSLKETSPKEKAAQLRVRGRRIARIAEAAQSALAAVDQPTLEKLKGLDGTCRAAEAAAAIAAQGFVGDPQFLPGTGGGAWRELFEAAHKFSAVAYPGALFPHVAAGARCLLCQQPLEGGAACLVRFEEFVQQEAEKLAKARRKELADAREAFVRAGLTLGLDAETLAEVAALDAASAAESVAFEQAVRNRHARIVAALSSHDWSGIPDMPVSPADKLRACEATLGVEATVLEQAADEAARLALQARFAEMDARIRLSQRKVALLSAIAKLVLKGKLSTCLAAVGTTGISLKAREVTERVVSEEMADALNAEYQFLGVNDLEVSLQSRVEKGKRLHKLKLNLPQAHSPAAILSEGEQRAIAIGSFLAEVRLAGGPGGVVFDDPVSSLDHRYRQRVARRLAQEATVRQVIVFTHDLYFLSVLQEEAESHKAPIMAQTVARHPHGFGVAEPDLPFAAKTTKARLGALRAEYPEIVKLYKEDNEGEYRRRAVDAYRQLRDAWERAIEEVLFRKVVVRFRNSVQTHLLREVLVEDADYAQVNGGMTKCSRYAHDTALDAGVAAPDPDELFKDISELEEWRERIETRSKKVGESRKSL
jgi:energy-coupling factor transporter ATP-binding protein EcfA2